MHDTRMKMLKRHNSNTTPVKPHPSNRTTLSPPQLPPPLTNATRSRVDYDIIPSTTTSTPSTSSNWPAKLPFVKYVTVTFPATPGGELPTRAGNMLAFSPPAAVPVVPFKGTPAAVNENGKFVAPALALAVGLPVGVGANVVATGTNVSRAAASGPASVPLISAKATKEAS